jgi:hypothetical protein
MAMKASMDAVALKMKRGSLGLTDARRLGHSAATTGLSARNEEMPRPANKDAIIIHNVALAHKGKALVEMLHLNGGQGLARKSAWGTTALVR